MFSSVLVIVFFFFRFGSRAFATATQRQGVQSEALRVMDSIQADLARSSYTWVVTAAPPARAQVLTESGQQVNRDALSFITLQNWTNPQDSHNFIVNEGGQPNWNRYLVYYATRNPKLGILYRTKIDPSPPPISPLPMLYNRLTSTIQEDPTLNRYDGKMPEYMALARNVYEFTAEKSQGRVTMSLKLREKRRLRPDGVLIQGEETYELSLSVHPQNSYPSQEI